MVIRSFTTNCYNEWSFRTSNFPQKPNPPRGLSTGNVKADKLSCRKVSNESLSEIWKYFINMLDSYKTATLIIDNDVALQLLESCEDSLRKDPHCLHWKIHMATEIDALAAIKTLAVKAEKAMVNRITFLTVTRHKEESVRCFGARLRGHAKVWNVSKNCSSNSFEAINHTDNMVCDALIERLGYRDIQRVLLDQTDKDMTLEGRTQFKEIKEDS